MLQTAIIGVIGSGRVRQCLECRAALGPDAGPCAGFGPGCFLPRVARTPEPPAQFGGFSPAILLSGKGA